MALRGVGRRLELAEDLHPIARRNRHRLGVVVGKKRAIRMLFVDVTKETIDAVAIDARVLQRADHGKATRRDAHDAAVVERHVEACRRRVAKQRSAAERRLRVELQRVGNGFSLLPRQRDARVAADHAHAVAVSAGSGRLAQRAVRLRLVHALADVPRERQHEPAHERRDDGERGSGDDEDEHRDDALARIRQVPAALEALQRIARVAALESAAECSAAGADLRGLTQLARTRVGSPDLVVEARALRRHVERGRDVTADRAARLASGEERPTPEAHAMA